MKMDISFLPAGFMMIAIIAFWAIIIIIHFCFAVAVLDDAGRLPAGRKPIFVGPGIWFLATLFGGVFVAAAYWAMHHSRLNDAVPVTQPEP